MMVRIEAGYVLWRRPGKAIVVDASRLALSALLLCSWTTANALAQNVKQPSATWTTKAQPAEASGKGRQHGKFVRSVEGSGHVLQPLPAAPVVSSLSPPTKLPEAIALSGSSEAASDSKAAVSGKTVVPGLETGAVGGSGTEPIALAQKLPAYDATALAYCTSIATMATDSRTAFLQETIETLEREMAMKQEQLEARIVEHTQWLAKRQQLSDQVGGALVQMFSRMRPDAASVRISAMDEQTAAILLVKLDPKAASAILGEVPPAKAARLSGIIAAFAELKQPQQPVRGQATDPIAAARRPQ